MISPPYGEGLVGKKFPWAYTVTCRADGGKEWCDGATKRKATRRKYPHGDSAGANGEAKGILAKLFGRRAWEAQRAERRSVLVRQM
eukprot:COSAG06_NODE_44770_length_360_cov_1.555556_1_plen_85_part_01